MAVTYEITRWVSPTVFHQVIRKRSDAAKAALMKAAYDMVKANALLDRQIGHRVMQDAEKLTLLPPDRGYYRKASVTLDHRQPLFGSVEIFIHRTN